MTPYQIGIDLGGTKTEVILFGTHGRALHRRRVATPRGGDNEYESILLAVCGLITETAGRVPPGVPWSVGIGIPGTIHPQTGLVQNANTTCLIDRPFKQDIETLLGREVAMDNDANCFTLAESRNGAARGYAIVFGIIMGTGCGGGLCLDGRVHRGAQRIAGEWGHFSIDLRGAICYCGNPGCVETKSSGAGVENAFERQYGERLEMTAIVDGYRRDDPNCRQVFEQFLDNFGRSLGGLISILDPDAVVIGGGLSYIDELYTLGVQKVKRYAFHQNVTTPILKNRLGDSAGVIGAAWLANT